MKALTLILVMGAIMLLIILSGFALSTIAEDRTYLESATCDQLIDLMRQSEYGVEYHNQWILKECWK